MEKVNTLTTFNQKVQFKSYIDKKKLRKKAKTDLKKDFLKLINNLVSGKIMENVKKNTEISSL